MYRGYYKKSGADCGNDFSNMLCGDRVALEYNQRVNETVRVMGIMDGIRKSWGYEIPLYE